MLSAPLICLTAAISFSAQTHMDSAIGSHSLEKFGHSVFDFGKGLYLFSILE